MYLKCDQTADRPIPDEKWAFELVVVMLRAIERAVEEWGVKEVEWGVSVQGSWVVGCGLWLGNGPSWKIRRERQMEIAWGSE